jgi:hypothetical protein
VERNRKAGQNPPRVIAPVEERKKERKKEKKKNTRMRILLVFSVAHNIQHVLKHSTPTGLCTSSLHSIAVVLFK